MILRLSLLILLLLALAAAEGAVDLTGRVVDESGKPVAGAQVRSYVLSFPPPEGRLEAEATTGADGTFTFQGLPSTERNSFRTILVQAEGYGLGGVSGPQLGGLTLRLGPAGSILGRIAGPEGKAISGAQIRVTGVWLPEAMGSPKHRFLRLWGDAAVLEAKSDAEGTFTLNGLPAEGQASLLVQHPDYGLRERNNVAVGDEAVSLTLELPGRIEGQVLAGTEETPAAGARVSCFWIQSDMTWTSAQTDGEGRYVLAGLGPGPHRLAVEPAGAYEGWLLLDPERSVEVKAGETTSDVVLRLTPGEPVRGRVVDAETGGPLAGVSVWSSSSLQSVKTKEDGTFELRAVPGEVWLQIQGAPPGYAREIQSRRVTVQAGAGATDIEFKLQRGISVKGRLLDPQGRPVPGAAVRYMQGWAESMATADDQGHFTLEGPLAGKKLSLCASVPEKGWAGQMTLQVEKEAMEPVTLKLGRAAAVRFTVTDPGKRPIEKVETLVYRRFETGEDISYRGEEVHLNRQDKTTYEIKGLVPGQEYFLQIMAEGYGRVQTGQFTLEAGETRELPAVVLRVADAVVEGRVLDPAGRPVAGAQVEVQSGRFAQATTDQDGRFRFEKQPPEALYLRVTHPDYEEDYQYDFNPDDGPVEFMLQPKFSLVQALPRPGEPAPELDCAYWLNSDRLSWKKLRGKVVLLAFSSAQTGPCEQILPTLKSLQAKYAARGFIVLQVQDRTATLAELRAWVKAREIPYPVAMVQSGMNDGWLGETFRSYGVQAVPALFLVDREGRLHPVQSLAGLSDQIEGFLR